MREGEVLEVPDFDDIYASDMVSMLGGLINCQGGVCLEICCKLLVR